MKNKTILGMWCTNSNCKFIDRKHIQIELTANIWYSYDNDSKTGVMNKKICFVKEIDLDNLNNVAEVIEEEKKIPEKLFGEPRHIYNENELYIVGKVNEIIDYFKSKGE